MSAAEGITEGFLRGDWVLDVAKIGATFCFGILISVEGMCSDTGRL